jgi:isoleucyl-tRNA synthetase
MVLGVGLFGVSPYKNVIVHGMVLAEDGKKMSKRLKNYPDIMHVINKYGADSLRYYLLSSPVIRGEELWFSEKGVAEIMRKLIMRLDNVYAFYKLYRSERDSRATTSEHVLDRWIVARLRSLENTVRESVENYELDRATRPILDFVDDLSTWYLRRSRERLKGADGEGAKEARETLHFTLKTLSQIMAPFTPFYAEYLYRELKSEDDPESVHLTDWPELALEEAGEIAQMQRVREIVTLGLQERSTGGVKVRQPLASFTYGGEKLEEELESIIADELNVKSVIYEEGKEGVALDLSITPELRSEGIARELVRLVQNKRKEAGLSPHDEITLTVETDKEGMEVVTTHKEMITSVVGARELVLQEAAGQDEAEVLEGVPFSVSFT